MELLHKDTKYMNIILEPMAQLFSFILSILYDQSFKNGNFDFHDAFLDSCFVKTGTTSLLL